MSDELEVAGHIEGEIVEDTPFASEAEAQRFMVEAVTLLKVSYEGKQRAQELLVEARRREAWKAMGFENWGDCLAATLSDVLHVRIDQVARVPMVAELRMQNKTAAEIAASTGTSKATAWRDLETARSIGLLPEEPERMIAADGRQRPVRGQKGVPRQAPRRADFVKSFSSRFAALEKEWRALKAMRDTDKRYKEHLPTLADNHGKLLAEITESLVEVQEDFVLVSQDEE